MLQPVLQHNKQHNHLLRPLLIIRTTFRLNLSHRLVELLQHDKKIRLIHDYNRNSLERRLALFRVWALLLILMMPFKVPDRVTGVMPL
jgi:hypothetical protein